MKLSNKFFKAALSAEVILMTVLLVVFIIIQSVYPKWSFAQAIVMAIVVLFVRVMFKVSESKDDTQILEKKE